MNDFYNDNYYINRCRTLIAEKLAWRPKEEWRNYEFTELSERIFDSTGVQLSITTLKRIFGKVKYENLPSSATLNTLAAYLGFTNWMDFKSKGIADNLHVEANKPVAMVTTTSNLKKRVFPAALLASTVLIIVFGFIVLSGKSSTSSFDTSSILFKSRSLADGLPNTVVFTVDLKGMKSKNIKIQQSWDSTKTIPLQPGQTEATGVYYVPGYFRAKIIVDGKILKEHDLFIPSSKWVATIDHEPVPTYLNSPSLIFDGHMHVSAKVISDLQAATKPLTLSYHLVRPFNNLSSDNFSLETRFQHVWGEGPAICKTVKLFILCTQGAFIIPFTIPGCVGEVNLKLNDHVLAGRSNDLSAFSTDPTLPMNLNIEVRNREVSIILNGKLISKQSYQEDAGNVVGFRYSFLGAGKVDYLKLSDKSGNLVFEERFTGK